MMEKTKNRAMKNPVWARKIWRYSYLVLYAALCRQGFADHGVETRLVSFSSVFTGTITSVEGSDNGRTVGGHLF